ncbi:MAG: CCA tRNA nucleotidyltransferase [Actinobacteria bacterium]|nr:CCA tRNA nucleotidyltransferase [Actinomycetota bacterium]
MLEVLDLARQILADEEAWIVGGAVRDELLGRPVLDVDIACAEPQRAARAHARRSGGAPFPLSERHGAWRVTCQDGRTLDFTPLRGSIDADLATRDFGLNAIAVPLAGGEPHDPYGGRDDLEQRAIRAVGDGIFADDPLRLLRAVRLERELGFRLDARTEALLRESAARVGDPAGERILGELVRLDAGGFRRLCELGLLAPLGGSLGGPLDAIDDPGFRLVVVLGERLEWLPISNQLRRYARTLLRAEPPRDTSRRAVHRFRRETEPWALDALAFLGFSRLEEAVEAARARDPTAPLVRGDELGLPPGPQIGRALEAIAEERAAGTLSTKEEALELARRLGRA